MEEVKCKSCSKEPIEKINILRFIDKLDACLKTNDVAAAEDCIEYWEKAARENSDSCALLSILNEKTGFYRTNSNENKALTAVYEAVKLIEQKNLQNNVSAATVYVNAATTLKAFGKVKEGIPLYEKAEQIYKENGNVQSYEYAALLNNKATALEDLDNHDEAEKLYSSAIEILEKIGGHDVDVAISLIGLAHLYFNRDDAYDKVEELLDKAWEKITEGNQPHDASYANAILKCVSSLKYFKRQIEAQALEEVAKEIYGENG